MQPGESLAFKRGKGYYAAPVDYTALAAPQVNAVVNPQIDAAKAARDAALQSSTDRANFITQLYSSLHDLLAPQGGQAEQTFSGAADRQAVIAKGFSMGQQIAQQHAAQDAAGYVAKQGLPGGQVQDTSQAAADTLYGLGGFNPAGVLNAGAAAFKASGNAAANGANTTGSLLASAGLLQGGQQAASDYAKQLSQIEAQRAQLLPSIASDLRNADFQKANYTLAVQKANAAASKPITFGSSQAGYYKMDPVTGEVTKLTDGTGQPGKVVGSDATGRGWYDPNTGSFTPITGPVAGKKKARFTQYQISEFKDKAATWAKFAWEGQKQVDKTTGKWDGKSWISTPQTYQTAIAFMTDHGIPLAIAQQALNRYWKKPGFDADPTARQNGQTKWVQSGTGRPKVPYQQRVGKGNAAAETAASPKAQAVVSLAKEALGTPYVWGGESPSGFDCSGLLQYVWGKMGVAIPRVTYDQWTAGTPVARNQLEPGDAVFFKGADPKFGKPGHVGMYLGGGKFIEAPRTGLNVRISNLAGRSDYVGARRYG